MYIVYKSDSFYVSNKMTKEMIIECLNGLILIIRADDSTYLKEIIDEQLKWEKLDDYHNPKQQRKHSKG